MWALPRVTEKKTKEFKEPAIAPPSSVWQLAVSRIAAERNYGHASLSLLLLLFESVLDIRLDPEEGRKEPMPWIVYRKKMYGRPFMQGRKMIDTFAAPIHARFFKPGTIITSEPKVTPEALPARVR